MKWQAQEAFREMKINNLCVVEEIRIKEHLVVV